MAKFLFKHKVRVQFKPGAYTQFYPGVNEVPDEYADHGGLKMVATRVEDQEPVEQAVEHKEDKEDKPAPKGKS